MNDQPAAPGDLPRDAPPGLPPGLPSAAELGVSEAEYERILRDLGRHGVGVPHPAPLALAPPAPATGLSWSSKAWIVVVAALAAVIVLLPRLGSDEPPVPEYAFLQSVGDQPVGYSSCRPIQVAVYPAGGPPDAEKLVREAVARVRGVTGLDIVVIGAFGGHAPNWNFEAAPIGPNDPVSVSWQDGSAIAAMTDDTAGLGGSPVISSPSGTKYRVAGTIALSRDYYRVLTQQGDHAEALAVLLHEFGHVLGLDHVDSPHELMYDENNGRDDFGPGDLEGLRRLGRAPCI
jgi:Zn-dependent protease with chaperone function